MTSEKSAQMHAAKARKRMALPKSEKWSIGHYYGDSSLCVNLEFDGRRYHRHDHGVSLIPRFIRLGWAITSIERESGLLTYRDELKAIANGQKGMKK
jgi:hypothetical protein